MFVNNWADECPFYAYLDSYFNKFRYYTVYEETD